MFDAQTLLAMEILTLQTTAGDVDLLANVKGIGGYRDVEVLAETKTFEGHELRVLSIDGLIVAKRATARPKDQAGLIELEALREARELVRGEAPSSNAPVETESGESKD